MLQLCDLWLIPINKVQCVALHLGVTNPCLNYHIGKVSIKNVDKYIDLGIIIQNDLKWCEREHIQSTVKKANIIIYLLSRAFETLPKNHF